MVKKYNPMQVRQTINNKDFLYYYPKAKEIRGNCFFIHTGGTKASGKSTGAALICAELRSLGYEVLMTRASDEGSGDPDKTQYRRALLERQLKKDPTINWWEVVDALRMEAAASLEKTVMPFITTKRSNEKKKVVIFNRYPPTDTLVRQYLAGAGLEEVASHLKSNPAHKKSSKYKSGYIKPDLTLVWTCGGAEASYRKIKRLIGGRLSSETIDEDRDSTQNINAQKEWYHKLYGYDNITKSINLEKVVVPGQVIITESDTDLDYLNLDMVAIDEKLNQKSIETVRGLVKKIIEIM